MSATGETEMERLDRGDARVGDVVTPVSRISTSDAEPIFQAGERLTVIEDSGGVILKVQSESGKTGTWCCSVFTFAEPKPREQRLHEALLDVLAALSPLKVVGQPVVALDHKLAWAVKRAEVLTESD